MVVFILWLRLIFAIMDKEEKFEFPYCDDISKYDIITKIGQGTFGEVYKARLRKTDVIVALKLIFMENEKQGFPITALREIKILKSLKHENIVNLIEICRSRPTAKPDDRFILVFDFCEHDLAGLLSNSNVHFTMGEIKQVIMQLLNALFYIHHNKIIHRDLKTANVLVTKNGIIKLADFGLARTFSKTTVIGKNGENHFTNPVMTLYYRAPELLLGERNYGPPIDLWGAGCIMAEMWSRSPIMMGTTEQQQLRLISKLCGSINPSVWPDVEKLQLYHKLELLKDQKRKVIERFKWYVKDKNALDLLDKLLTLDPSRRIDSHSALDHDLFWTDPMPHDLSKMLSTHTTSMFEYFTCRNGELFQTNNRHSINQTIVVVVQGQQNNGQCYDRVF